MGSSTARTLSFWLSVVALAVASGAACAQTPAQECLRLVDAPFDRSNQAAFDKMLQTWKESCQQAVAANPTDTRYKFALSKALWHKEGRPASLGPLREAIAQGDTTAMLALFNDFNSFDRNPGRPDLIPRDEAEKALRRAAELGDSEAMGRLAALLERGGPIKRDRAEARLWLGRALAKPSKDTHPIDNQISLGNWLAKSENADERKRGIEILESVAKNGRGDAETYLAAAIRAEDPMRARKLLESARHTYSGHALAPLSDMLIKGEGGPKDEKRAVKLLQGSAYDAQHAKWALGQLMLEGRLVPRDVAQAVKLIGPWSQWDYDTRIQIVRLLAENPEVRLEYAQHFLYQIGEAAELGEPGAADALVALKLSANIQFADKAGGCAIAERAAKRGETIDAGRLAQCRAK